jgi:anti-sigma B factor antagonist
MPQEPLQVEEVRGAPDGVRVLRLNGPVLLTNFFEFQAKVRASNSPTLILDLTGVPYMDSAGIGALVGAYVTHQKDGRHLALVGVTDRVRSAMQITRVEQFFHLYESVGAAEAATAKP